jgi:hypothetical protein
MSAPKKLPFIAWRPQPDGTLRPRFMPSQREINLGFPSCDLRHPGIGGWFTIEEVTVWLYGPDGRGGVYGEILRARKTGSRSLLTIPQGSTARSVEALLDDWLQAIEADRAKALARGDKPMAENTIASYRKDVEALRWQPETRAEAKSRRERSAGAGATQTRLREPFVEKPIAAIGVPELKAHFEYVRDIRGWHMALHVIAAFSAAWTWGQTSTIWRLGPNPRHELTLPRPGGRCVLIDVHELTALVRAADALERPSIGDAVMLGLFTGQRQNDRLTIGDDGIIDGRRRFKQRKTNMVVEIKEAPALLARLDDARKRVSALMLKTGVRERPNTIIVDESTCAPYESNAYRHRFSDVRTIAIHGWIEGETAGQAIARGERIRDRAASDPGDIAWKIPPCPSLGRDNNGNWDPKRDQDLRDTCVTLLYRAGNDLQRIADVTGHTYASVKTIVENYLARDRSGADLAIDRLVAFMEKEGLAV